MSWECKGYDSIDVIEEVISMPVHAALYYLLLACASALAWLPEYRHTVLSSPLDSRNFDAVDGKCHN